MSEPSTTRLFCRDCKTEIFRVRTSGRPPTRCERCKAAAVKAANRVAYLKTRQDVVVPTEFTCEDCQERFPRTRFLGRPEFLCTGCKVTRHRRTKANDDARTARLRAEAWEATGRWSRCRGCATPLKCGRTGHPYEWCKPCYLKHRRDHKYVPTPRRGIYQCLDCPATLRPGYNNLGKLRCPPCGRRRTRALAEAWRAANYDRYLERVREAGHRRRARIRGVGYESFKHREIFDRDGWKCGICRRRINRRLKYPHPMAVSIDHKVPTIKGGPHSRSNTQASHARCNNKKRAHVAPLGEQIPLPI